MNGYKDWVLPTYDVLIDAYYFSSYDWGFNLKNDVYWTAEAAYNTETSSPAIVLFAGNNGYGITNNGFEMHYVRPVRFF